MGSEWQTPSLEQLDELVDNRYTTISDEMVNGVIGRRVTSKANGKSIFLPCCGWMVYTELNGADKEGACYWSRTLDTESSYSAFILYVYDSVEGAYNIIVRSSGCAVRAVRKK